MLSRRLRAPAVLVALLAGVGAGRAAEYRLKVGDTLELALTGVDVQRRMTVDVDGRISVPLAGEMRVAGSTVSDVLTQLRATLPTKSLNIRTAEGRDSVTVIAPDEISLSVAEYTGVFLNGDVARPGSQPFRPGMTVRQGISLAGGYDLLRFRVDGSTLGSIDLQDEYRTVSMELERAVARLALVRADLGQPPAAARATPGLPNPVPAAARRDIAGGEADVARARTDLYRSQRAALQKALASDDDNVRVLAAQKRTEEESYRFDLEETERVNDLFRKGTVPVTRVGEAKRLTLLSATRVLQVAAQLEIYQRQRLNTLRDIDRIDADRRTELLNIAQETEGAVRRSESRLQAVWDKLLFSTSLRSQLAGGRQGGPRLEIVRSENGEIRRLPADEDAPLEPGDVVEVRLQINVDQFEARN